MLWIEFARLQEPASWATSSATAFAQLQKAATPADRAKRLGRGNVVWTTVKPALEALSHAKCWYCDSRQDRSYLAVDHYRPKGKLLDVTPPHDGYWWLAFDLANYRLACINCNSVSRDADGQVKGKQNLFPLDDETHRVRLAGGSLTHEVPLLLDPVRSADPALLFFDTDGLVRPNPVLCPNGSLNRRRAEATIDVLNLNQPGIRDRRKRLYRQMSRDYQHASSSFDGFVNGDAIECERFLGACEALKECVAEVADLASNARSFLSGWRGTSGFSQVILQAVL